MSFEIGWKNLWNKDDTLEQTSQEEREEWILEVLGELRSKYKRRTKSADLNNFELAKWDGANQVIVTYPNLKDKTADELKEIATMILSFGQITNVNVFKNREVYDVFGIEQATEVFKD